MAVCGGGHGEGEAVCPPCTDEVHPTNGGGTRSPGVAKGCVGQAEPWWPHPRGHVGCQLDGWGAAVASWGVASGAPFREASRGIGQERPCRNDVGSRFRDVWASGTLWRASRSPLGVANSRRRLLGHSRLGIRFVWGDSPPFQ